ncbi:MAG: thiamine phosphate synthase [Burkholderiales bacterium]|nr:thiamine phosphate synthase [Burkholderiales bacterium]
MAGLYAITPDWTDTARLLIAARAALGGGARVLQYRNKRASPTLRLEQALALSAVCRAHDVPFIVNDDVELALEVDADGVHLGRSDEAIATARRRIGRRRLLGASCYNEPPLATAALAAGADHVAFGSVFPSSTKPGAVRAALALFASGAQLGVPVVAIGGITVENAGTVVAAGASAVAVISDLFEAADVARRAGDYAALFS